LTLDAGVIFLHFRTRLRDPRAKQWTSEGKSGRNRQAGAVEVVAAPTVATLWWRSLTARQPQSTNLIGNWSKCKLTLTMRL